MDLFFPIHCLFCQKGNLWICEKCLTQIQINTEQVCGVCEKVFTPFGLTCHNCKKQSALAGLLVVSPYSQATVSKAVHLFKYRFVQDLHEPLANLLVQALRKTELPLPDIILPIPLHPRRLRWRGFNQAELLARHVARNLLPDCELQLETKTLIRSRYTSPQMSIKNFAHRKQNISGAFFVNTPEKIQNKTVLLVDDVATTGSTIFECAKVLKTAGAREVFAIVLARQETKK